MIPRVKVNVPDRDIARCAYFYVGECSKLVFNRAFVPYSRYALPVGWEGEIS